MADISKIKINNVSYNIKDTQAHSSLNSLSQSITTVIVRTDELHLPKTGNDVVIEYDQTTQSVTFTTTALGQQGAETKTISLPVVMNGEVAVKEKSFGKVWYDSGRMRIYFLTEDTEFDNDGNPIGSTSEHTIAILDATPFVKDAMVSNVAITGGNLVITWNSDAGIQPTSIPLTDIFNPANYYNKDEIDQIIADVEAGQVDIVDNLTTNDATKALSAKQGKVLQDNKANKNEMTVTDVTGDATKKTIQLKSGTSQTVVVEHQDISGKQDKINDLSTIRSGAGKGATSVQTISVNNGTPMQPTNGNVDITIPSAAWADVKPSGGVPKSDLASGVQTSLGKADTAIQGVKVNGTELTPGTDKKVSLSAVTGLQFDGSSHVGVVQLPEYVKTSDYNTTIDGIYQSIPSDLADLADDETHRVVTDAEKSTWNNKQNALTFDNTPTKLSTNPVKSGGVYSALADLYDGYDPTTETLSFTFPTE